MTSRALAEDVQAGYSRSERYVRSPHARAPRRGPTAGPPPAARGCGSNRREEGSEGIMSEYDTDILRGSERQAEPLRRVATGERVNDQVDWENVIDEVESVGNEQLHAQLSI